MLKYSDAFKNNTYLTLMAVTIMYMLQNSVMMKLLNKKLANSNLTNYSYILTIDTLTSSFILLVSLVSINVINYTSYYMNSDLFKTRFNMVLYLFVMMMFLLAISQNILLALLGWDGLGITSYILVSYYQNNKSTSSATMTIAINRLGDATLVMTAALMLPSEYIDNLNFMLPTMVMFTIACMIKSAQFPFSSWLPEAMAAPTPVSSLVHSSTLVTAGLFLLMRHIKLVEQLHLSLIMMGVTTMLFSSYSAYGEFNIKKIIALSTLSQLGLMFLFLGSNMMEMTLFHLNMHAFFKSMLFMMAGTFLVNMQGNLDMRYISAYHMNFNSIMATTVLGNITLMGAPFYSGFFSKDLSMELSISEKMNLYILLSVLVSIFMTVLYSTKLLMSMNYKITNFIMNKLKLKEMQMSVIIMPCVVYTVYLAWLYMMSMIMLFTKSAIFYMTKMYMLFTLLTSMFFASMFWKKSSKSFKKAASNSYFMKYNWTYITKLINKMTYSMLINDKNLLNLMFGSKTYYMLFKMMMLIIKMINNYIKALLFMLLFILLFL